MSSGFSPEPHSLNRIDEPPQLMTFRLDLQGACFNYFVPFFAAGAGKFPPSFTPPVGYDKFEGLGAIVLNHFRIGAGSIVGAGPLIPKNTVVQPGSEYLGVPGRRVRDVTLDEGERIERHAISYIRCKDFHLEAARKDGD